MLSAIGQCLKISGLSEKFLDFLITDSINADRYVKPILPLKLVLHL